MEIASLLN